MKIQLILVLLFILGNTAGDFDDRILGIDGQHPEFLLDPNIETIDVGLMTDSYDLENSIIITNQNHQIIDMVYHSKQQSDDGAIKHQGDNDGYDEIIQINLSQLNPKAHHIYVVASISTEEVSFHDVSNIYSDFIHDGEVVHHQSIQPEFLEKADSNISIIISQISRTHDYNTWQINEVDIEMNIPKSIIDMETVSFKFIQPTIICYETRECPLPEYAHVQLQEPDFQANFQYINSDRLITGLAWGGDFDFDFSVIISNSANNIIESVYFSKLSSKDGSIKHKGDQQNGHKLGYDEMINININNIDSQYYDIYFVASIYSSSQYFTDYPGYIKFDIFGNDHRYQIHDQFLFTKDFPNANNTGSVILGRVSRERAEPRSWYFLPMETYQLPTFNIRVIKESNFQSLEPIVNCYRHGPNYCN